MVLAVGVSHRWCHGAGCRCEPQVSPGLVTGDPGATGGAVALTAGVLYTSHLQVLQDERE